MKQCQERICPYCKKEFTVKKGRSNSKYCSHNCAVQSRRKNVPKTCLYCTRYFLAPRNHPKQKFCSLECRDKAQVTKVTQPCNQCGQPVTRQATRAKTTKYAFCNTDCRNKWFATNAKVGSEHIQYIERISVFCEVCGKQINRKPSEVNKHNFCNVDCRLIWQKESSYNSGSNSPTWKGGYKEYYGRNWLSQRRNARRRDNYTCQRCGKKETTIGKQLDVHHIKPFREFSIDHYAEANSLDNLICYCNVCHLIVEHGCGSRLTLSAEDMQLPLFLPQP